MIKKVAQLGDLFVLYCSTHARCGTKSPASVQIKHPSISIVIGYILFIQ